MIPWFHSLVLWKTYQSIDRAKNSIVSDRSFLKIFLNETGQAVAVWTLVKKLIISDFCGNTILFLYSGSFFLLLKMSKVV